uniref:AAA+ ATPase domain-containing protein n=1 Tax=Hyaloperonospora arabidopsidis (strain Emoy2) TaxID=559515 RepID=M4BLP4_HYAAE
MILSIHRFRPYLPTTNPTSFIRSFSTSGQAQKPSVTYNALVTQGRLVFDAHQAAISPLFDRDAGKQQQKEEVNFKSVVKVPRGLYVHGGIGTGKSLLLDLFFHAAKVECKRRVHFNDFMLDLHTRLAREKTKELLRQDGRQNHVSVKKRRDVVVQVAHKMADESHLLCFDEFQVTDVADALIMRKVFGVLFARGVVMVATSNTPPQDLYKDGTNREYFLPFLDQLARHTKVLSMNSDVDYRLLCEPLDRDRTFLTPLSTETRHKMDQLYQELLACGAGDSNDNVRDELLHVPVMMGRSLDIRGSMKRGVCRASFSYLCGTEKGAADYKAMAECFHTVMLDDVPVLSMAQHDQARRLIVLIDELYEHQSRLVLSSEAAEPREIFSFDETRVQVASESENNRLDAIEKNKQDLITEKASTSVPTSSCDAPGGATSGPFGATNLVALKDLKIAFKRAVSRLHEMQSTRYVEENQHKRYERVKLSDASESID